MSNAGSQRPSKETLREEDLRKELRAAMQQLKSREPLDPKYTRLLMSGTVWTHLLVTSPRVSTLFPAKSFCLTTWFWLQAL
jgi:hypothetical protein